MGLLSMLPWRWDDYADLFITLYDGTGGGDWWW